MVFSHADSWGSSPTVAEGFSFSFSTKKVGIVVAFLGNMSHFIKWTGYKGDLVKNDRI